MATATERLNNAIDSLRNDLIEMRTQDVQLMKQLLNISITIQKMTSERLCQSYKSYGKRSLESRTKRQNSAPSSMWLDERSRIDSMSSTEDTDFHDDTSEYSDTEDEIVPKSPKERFRRSSILSINPFSEDESNDSPEEGFLRTNIKLWKYTKDDDSD